MPLSSNQLEVDLFALKHNVTVLKDIVGSKVFYPVVKSNAYGLGLVPVTRTLVEEGLSSVVVLNTKEAHVLKSLGSLKVLIVEPFLEHDIDYIVRNSNFCQPIIGSWDTLHKIYSKKEKQKSYFFQTPLLVHIKIDIGMSRFGFQIEDIPKIIEFFKSQNCVQFEGLCSHLPGGKDIGTLGSTTHQQVKAFDDAVKKVAQEFPQANSHLFNSLNLVGYYSYNQPIPFGVRLGGCLYGIKHQVDCNKDEKWSSLDLKLICRLKSQVVSLRQIKKGQAVSYDGVWKADKHSTIAVVSIGYAEGVVKPQGKENISVLFRGQKCHVVGKICMNHLMIDITGMENPQIGEEVVIFGKQKGHSIDIEDWVSHEGTPYEVLTRIHPSVQRVYSKIV